MLGRPQCRRKCENILLATISDKAHHFPRGGRAGRAGKVLLAAFLNCSGHQMGQSELSYSKEPSSYLLATPIT